MNSATPCRKILILTANPQDTARLRLDQEVREIDAGLQRAQHRDQFVLEQKWAVRPRDIQRAMLDTNPSIVHFSGHGTGDEGLVFEDETGQAKLVDGEALAGLFELFAEQVECVVLNGCYSEIQASAIAQHIDYVIGMNKAIGDQAAIEFAVGFYDALGAGRPIEFAHKFGCAAIRLAGIPEHLTPVLKKKPGTRSPDNMQKHSKELFTNTNTEPKEQRTTMSERVINMGSGNYNERIQGNYVQGNYYTAGQQDSLAQAAAEIQRLLEQLDKSYSSDTTLGKMQVAAETIKRIEDNPTLAERIISALKAGGVQAFEQFLNHPAASFVIGALEDWQKNQDI